MKLLPYYFIFLLLACCSDSIQTASYDPYLKLWYDKPASIWEEALPLGNGKTGAMVFGGTAGITEMLLQSHDGCISLLPALPSEWSEGEVKGLKAKGGFTVNITWGKNSVTKATIHSGLGGICRIRSGIPVKVVETSWESSEGPNPNPFYKVDPLPEVINNSKVPLLHIPYIKGYMIDFLTEKGKSYTIIPL